MNFVLYSGGATAQNRHLHAALADLVGPKKRKVMTYVPFCADGALPFYKRFVRRYKPFGFSQIHFFPIDEGFSDEGLERALSGDAIYLAGGNTFYFLHQLRRRGLVTKLRDYAASGGVIAGLSAGAHILTPNIGLAGYPPFDADRNDVRISDLRALGLVPFEFFPHYSGKPTIRAALAKYSRFNKSPIVAAGDGGGAVIEADKMTFIGRVELFLGGAHGRLSV